MCGAATRPKTPMVSSGLRASRRAANKRAGGKIARCPCCGGNGQGQELSVGKERGAGGRGLPERADTGLQRMLEARAP